MLWAHLSAAEGNRNATSTLIALITQLPYVWLMLFLWKLVHSFVKRYNIIFEKWLTRGWDWTHFLFCFYRLWLLFSGLYWFLNRLSFKSPCCTWKRSVVGIMGFILLIRWTHWWLHLALYRGPILANVFVRRLVNLDRVPNSWRVGCNWLARSASGEQLPAPLSTVLVGIII